MQNLKVTLVQTTQYWENISENLEHFEKKINEIESTDLILLPEMFSTGFSMNVKVAEIWENSTALNFLKYKASQKNCAIYTSIFINDKGYYRNRGVFVYPDGNVVFYDKRKTFGMAGEDKTIAAGEQKVVVTYKSWNILLQICYDLRFPEISRNRIESGKTEFDLILYVANWPEKRIAHWKVLLAARSIENQAYVAGLNRIGFDNNNIQYNGQSAIHSPDATNLLELEDQDVIKSYSLSSDNLHTLQLKMPFLKDI